VEDGVVNPESLEELERHSKAARTDRYTEKLKEMASQERVWYQSVVGPNGRLVKPLLWAMFCGDGKDEPWHADEPVKREDLTATVLESCPTWLTYKVMKKRHNEEERAKKQNKKKTNSDDDNDNDNEKKRKARA
jgi:hypothetical protein